MHTYSEGLVIRDATAADVEAIIIIYNHYVRSSFTTFQETEATVDITRAKLETLRSEGIPYLVIEDTSTQSICGFAYADDWSERTAYRFTVASTIYLHPEYCRKGIGKLLLQRLLDELRACGKKQVLARASILPDQVPEDVPSCRLHMAFGYKPVGRLLKVGFKLEKWVDVLLLQLDLGDGAELSGIAAPPDGESARRRYANR